MLQPPPEIHSSSGFAAGVGRDDLEVLGLGRALVEVASHQLEAARDGVHVRVLEARDEHPPRQVDDLGARADEVAHLVAAHRDDAAAAHGDGTGA